MLEWAYNCGLVMGALLHALIAVSILYVTCACIVLWKKINRKGGI